MALIFLYLAVRKGFRPLLLLPISFVIFFLVNIYPDVARDRLKTHSNGVGVSLLLFLDQVMHLAIPHLHGVRCDDGLWSLIASEEACSVRL